MTFKLTYKPFGERAILIEWDAEINEAILKDIILLKAKITSKNIKEIVELKSAYNSLLVSYNYVVKNFENNVKLLNNIYFSQDIKHDNVSKLWKIPVCYNEKFGLDLKAVSEEKCMSESDIIKCHSDAVYRVYFIGFLPGFLYLGGLDNKLHIPRKRTPRLQVEKGAVAIGGNQTGVYPNASPGGWNIIGNSPINFFNVSKNQPCFAKTGDRIQFYPITLKEHQDIKILVDADVYQIESEVLND